MIRVLRIINRFNLGGPTYNVSYLTKYLPEDYQTLLIGGPEEEGEGSSLHITESLGIKPLILKELHRDIDLKKDYRSYKEIKKIIEDFKPHIVHTHASKAGAVGRLAAINCNVPVIVHTFHGHVFHSYFGKLKTLFYKTIERYLAKRSSAIVAISELQKNELVNIHHICEASKTHVIPLGFDLDKFSKDQALKREQFRRQHHIHADELAIGIIGRLAPIKNHELFIDAIEHVLKNTDQKIKAIIVGDGETKQQLIGYIQDKGLSYSTGNDPDAVFQFVGWQKDVDIVLCGIDLVTLSSKNEGTPVSLIEAQAAGKFIVTTNVGGIKDILMKGCGFISNTDSEFCNHLLNAVNNFNSLQEQAKSGIAFAKEKFSYKRLVKDMDALYRELIASNKLNNNTLH